MYRLTQRFSQSPSVSVSDTRCPSARCPALSHTARQSRRSCPWFHWAPPSSAPSETCWWPAASSSWRCFAVNALILCSAYSKTECKQHSSLWSYDHVFVPLNHRNKPIQRLPKERSGKDRKGSALHTTTVRRWYWMVIAYHNFHQNTKVATVDVTSIKP